MLFTGQSQHTIDAKQRLAIPAKYRNQWDPSRDGEAWFCVPWPTGHLRLYTEAAFTELAQREAASLTPDSDEASVESILYGFAERIEEDSAGRIILPRAHLDLAKIGAEVVVVGARLRLEVHNKERWQVQVLDGFQKLPQLIREKNARQRQLPR